VTDAGEHLVRVTHVFHPLFTQRLPCVGRRYNRSGERLLLQTDDARIWSVPPQWTDLAILDPELTMNASRMVLRFADVVELTNLVNQISEQSAKGHKEGCKGDYAADVRQITPQGDQDYG
jgi:hypothetical protein